MVSLFPISCAKYTTYHECSLFVVGVAILRATTYSSGSLITVNSAVLRFSERYSVSQQASSMRSSRSSASVRVCCHSLLKLSYRLSKRKILLYTVTRLMMYHLSILNRIEHNEIYQNSAFHHSPRPAQGLRENRPVGVGFVVHRCKPMATIVNGIGCQAAKEYIPIRFHTSQLIAVYLSGRPVVWDI